MFAYIFGCFAALVLGGGMCLTMLIESSIPVIYKKLVEKRTKSLLPVIDQEEERFADILERGNDLLRAELL